MKYGAMPPPLEEICRRILGRRSAITSLGARSVSIFGSCARGEQLPGSDIDVLVDLEAGCGYFDLAEIGSVLSQLFEVEVRPVLASGVSLDNPIRRERIVDVF